MEPLGLRGRVWVLGDQIDTDQITPGQYMDLPLAEMSNHVFETVAPGFAQEVQPGDIIVGGVNFGCGSSRETAPQVLKHLGVAAVLAGSFARIFFRNAIAIGLPVMVSSGLVDCVKRGDEIAVDFDAGRVIHLPTGQVFEGRRLPELLLMALKRGGLMALLVQG